MVVHRLVGRLGDVRRRRCVWVRKESLNLRVVANQCARVCDLGNGVPIRGLGSCRGQLQDPQVEEVRDINITARVDRHASNAIEPAER